MKYYIPREVMIEMTQECVSKDRRGFLSMTQGQVITLMNAAIKHYIETSVSELTGEPYSVPAPDCRTCRGFIQSDFVGISCLRHSSYFDKSWECTKGDKYEPAPRVVLWRTET